METKDSILQNLTELNKGELSESLSALPEADLQTIKNLIHSAWTQAQAYSGQYFEEYWSGEERRRLEEYQQQGTRYSQFYNLDTKEFDPKEIEHGWRKESRAGVYRSIFPNMIRAESDKSLDECQEMIEIYLEKYVNPIIKESRFFFMQLPDFVSKESLLGVEDGI